VRAGRGAQPHGGSDEARRRAGGLTVTVSVSIAFADALIAEAPAPARIIRNGKISTV
jgi:hypothetical protein